MAHPETGWPEAATVLGLLTLAGGVVGSLFMRDPPSDRPRDAGQRTATKGVFFIWKVLPRFLAMPAFLPVFLMFLLFNTCGQVFMAHLVNYVTDVGISPLTAAAMMSVVGIASVSGRLVAGFIGDRFGTKVDTVTCFAFVTLSPLLLLTFRTSEPAMWAAAASLGLGFGGTVPMVPALVAERFGTKHLGTINGMATLAIFTGAALGPWVAGFLFDIWHSYAAALGVAAVFSATTVVLAVSLRPTTQGERDRAEALLK